MAQATPEETSTLLNRLSQKPGVTSTLILSRTNGSVVRASGLVSTSTSGSTSNTTDVDGTAEVAPPASTQDLNSTTSNIAANTNGDSSDKQGKRVGMKSAENVARLVWRLFGSADGFCEELMGMEDEVRLLRLRTKRNEIVVVPDANFLLVVIHDTPPA